MADVNITDNSAEILAALGEQLGVALEAVGLKAEGYAKRKAPVDTGRLRNSISHAVSEEESVAYIGTNVEYAPYVEMGTRHTKPQPYLNLNDPPKMVHRSTVFPMKLLSNSVKSAPVP